MKIARRQTKPEAIPVRCETDINIKPWAKSVDGNMYEVICTVHGVIAAYTNEDKALYRALVHLEGTQVA